LASNDRVLCASPDYLRRRGEPLTIEDLAQHDCLVLTGRDGRQDSWRLAGPDGAPVAVRVRGRLESNYGEVLREAAVAGLGIAMHSLWHVHRDLAQGRLRAVLPGYRVPAGGLHAVMPVRTLVPARGRACVDHLAGRFADPPWASRATDQGRLARNSLKPLYFRSCPPSMADRSNNNYRIERLPRLHMYAVLVTGGKQYRVAQGETLRVEKLEAEAGNEISFDNILMLGGSDGVTIVDALRGATLTAKVVGRGRADKIRIIKFRRRKHHMKRQGHRQHYTEIEITGIAGGDKK